MKSRWNQMSVRLQIIVNTFLLALSPTVIFADDKASSEITSLPISYEKGVKYLSRFTSKAWFDKGFWGFGAQTAYLINSFVQGIFWFSKTTFFICSSIYQKLTDTSQFDQYIALSLNIGATIFNSLTSVDGGVLFFIGSLMFFYVGYVYFVKNGSFVRAFLQVILVYVCSSLLFMQQDGKFVLQHIYDGMNTVTQDIAEKSIKGFQFAGGEEKEVDSNLVSQLPDSDQSALANFNSLSSTKQTNAVLDKYFDIAVWQPYQYMNGKVTSTEAGKVTFDLSTDEFITLLDYDSGNDKFKIGDKTMKNFVGYDENVHHPMLAAAWGEKFTHVLASLVDAFTLGVILDLFAIMSFGTKIIIMLLFLLSGFVALISMIPTFENVLFNYFKRLGGSVVVSGLLSLCSLILLWIYDLLSAILQLIFLGNPLLIAFCKILIMWYMWKKRDYIISILTANRVSQLSNNLTNRISRTGSYLQRKASKKALSRLETVSRSGRQFSSGMMKVGARKSKAGIRQLSDKMSPKELTKAGLYLNTLQDAGRSLSSKKDRLTGKMKMIRAEGIKDKNGIEYRELRKNAEADLSRSDMKRSRILGYHKRKSLYDKGLVPMRRKSSQAQPRVYYNYRNKERLKSVAKPVLQRNSTRIPKKNLPHLPQQKKTIKEVKPLVKTENKTLQISSSRNKKSMESLKKSEIRPRLRRR